MNRRELRAIPTPELLRALRAAELLDNGDRIGFRWGNDFVEASISAICRELASRDRVAAPAAAAGRRGVRALLDLGPRRSLVRRPILH